MLRRRTNVEKTWSASNIRAHIQEAFMGGLDPVCLVEDMIILIETPYFPDRKRYSVIPVRDGAFDRTAFMTQTGVVSFVRDRVKTRKKIANDMLKKD
jgi:hypothetical protein